MALLQSIIVLIDHLVDVSMPKLVLQSRPSLAEVFDMHINTLHRVYDFLVVHELILVFIMQFLRRHFGSFFPLFSLLKFIKELDQLILVLGSDDFWVVLRQLFLTVLLVILLNSHEHGSRPLLIHPIGKVLLVFDNFLGPPFVFFLSQP